MSRSPGSASAYVAAAIAESGQIDRASRTTAERAVAAAIAGLDGWAPMLAEAPFKLDLGDDTRRLVTYGYIDLVAGRGDEVMLLDYKSGQLGEEKWPLQLALYRAALREAYALEVTSCRIGRIAGETFELVEVEPLGEDELRAGVAAVADALESGDMTARAGPWCAACAYRAAPCMDYAPAASPSASTSA